MKSKGCSHELEQVLIKGCVKGTKSSQQELYEKYSPKMFGICLRYSGDFHQAEDLLQEGFVKVYRNIQKFRGDGSFEGWLRRIFVNTAIEHYRKNNPLYPINDAQVNDHEMVNNNAVNDLAVNDLLEMVKRLSPGYRTVFNLYAIEGYSHKEIAEMLAINEGTSKSQLARARYILQNMILRYQESKYEAII